MSLEVKLERHTGIKETPYGPVVQDMNQDKVYVLNDETGKFTHCGFVGVHAFLPLCGFPQELVEAVTAECERQLGRPLSRGDVPLTFQEIQDVVSGDTDDDSEFEDD